ncbi:hypothetical protein OG331_03545 [Streptomyces sp. NBC_01017]|nr:hypothetical protein OG331_03545 [Streptomyces sp. NBC_01017]
MAEETVRGSVPLLVTVRVRGVLWLLMPVGPKPRVLWSTLRAPLVPVALRGMVRSWAVVLRVRVALRGPGAWGVWVRVRVQVWVGGRGVVQVLSVMR